MPSYELKYSARGTFTVEARDQKEAVLHGHEWLLHLLEEDSPPPGRHPQVFVVDTLVWPKDRWSR